VQFSFLLCRHYVCRIFPVQDSRIHYDMITLECVSEFIYLGSLVTKNNDFNAEISRRINLSSQRMGMLSSGELSVKTKIDVLISCVFSRLLHAAETWTLKAVDAEKLLAFEMRCYRRILKVCWKDKVSNKTIRDKVQIPYTVVDLIKQAALPLDAADTVFLRLHSRSIDMIHF